MGRPRTVVTMEAVELAVALLARRIPKSKIYAALTAAGHAGSRRSHTTVIACARERLRRLRVRTKESYEEQAIAFYEAVIADSGASVRDRLKAQEQLEHLLGIGARYGDASATLTAVDVAAALRSMDAAQRPPAAVEADPPSGEVQGGVCSEAKRKE